MLKKLKLSSKISIIITIMLVVIFSIFIFVTAQLTMNSLKNVTFREITSISSDNAARIQPTLTTATLTAENLTNYLIDFFEELSKINENLETETESFKSEVSSDFKFQTELNKDTENFLFTTALNAAIGDEGVYGVSVLFEPYKYDSKIKSYSLYATSNGNVTPFGEYDDYSKEDWYSLAKEQKKIVFTKPYIYNNSMTFITVASPIYYNNDFKGIVKVDIDINKFSEVVKVSEAYKTMYTSIMMQDGTYIYNSKDSSKVGINAKDTFKNPAELENAIKNASQTVSYNFNTVESNGNKVNKFYTAINAADDKWFTVSTVDTKDVNEEAVKTSALLVVLSIAALIVIVFIVISTIKKMIKPISSIVDAAHKLSNGDLNINLDVKSHDEIGMLSEAFNNTGNTLKNIISDISFLLEEIGKGNFNIHTKIEEEYVGDFHNIMISMRNIVIKLSDTLQQINEASDQVASGSDQVSSGAQALSQGATEQASSIEELAATINEISSQIKSNSENALSASGKANIVGKEMLESNHQMEELINAINKINISSEEIGKIIKTIEDIAFQTNILALNAAVEAARAGTAGKGFAVVADEVRNLASKSSEASKNTADLIETSIKAVKHGTEIADGTAKSLLVAVEGANEVASIINKISEASELQAESIQQVTVGVDQISSVIQTNSATAEESAASSEELSGQSQILKGLVSKFSLRKN